MWSRLAISPACHLHLYSSTSFLPLDTGILITQSTLTMQPSNILVALSALFLGQAQASPTPEKLLHPTSHIKVEFFDGYGKSYTEKVWPDGDEHWFSKFFITTFSLLLTIVVVCASGCSTC